MGWQDRDWAKFDDDELQELYGVAPRRTTSARRWIWSVVAVAVLAIGGFAYTQRQSTAAFGDAPTALVGARGTDTRIPASYPGGTDTVCTEEGYDQTQGQWTCLSWQLNVRHLPVVVPADYVGSCTHLLADQTSERWTCLGAGFVPQQQQPAATTGGSA